MRSRISCKALCTAFRDEKFCQKLSNRSYPCLFKFSVLDVVSCSMSLSMVSAYCKSFIFFLFYGYIGANMFSWDYSTIIEPMST